MLLIETALIALALLLALVRPSIGSAWFSRVEHQLSRFAQRRALSVAVVGISALVLRAAVLPVEPIPEPSVHDEFGYLLAADTFAHGRLTNPTPPMWEHFESFSILVKPTYQCFGQPAQGMILALGKVVFGHPFWGVWLTTGIMCAAMTWMLQGWLAQEWALLGGVLAILRYGVFGYWANSYWGGAVGAVGGALVMGALPRIKQYQRVRDALLMGIGLAILANNRPYEGFVFSLTVAFALLAWMLGEGRPSIRTCLRRLILPLGLVLSLTAVLLGYYFCRVTGSSFRMPYQIERQTYAKVPFFLWQRPLAWSADRVYRSEAMRQVYDDGEIRLYRVTRTPIGLAYVEAKKIIDFWIFFIGPILTVPLLALAFVLPYGFSWRDISPQIRFFLIAFAVSAVALAAAMFFSPHYAAPLTCVTLALLLRAMQTLREYRQGQSPRAVFITRALLLICLLMFVIRIFASARHMTLVSNNTPAWHEQGPPSFGRSQVESTLQRLPRKQLVIVHYDLHHNPFEEWVYNDADIANAHIVWARELGPAENDTLADYFKDRQVWRLDADAKPPQLSYYTRYRSTAEENPN